MAQSEGFHQRGDQPSPAALLILFHVVTPIVFYLAFKVQSLRGGNRRSDGHPNLLVRAHVAALRCYCLCLRFFRFQNTFAVLGFCFCSSVGLLLHFSAGPLAPTSLSRFHFAARWRLISLSPFTTIGLRTM